MGKGSDKLACGFGAMWQGFFLFYVTSCIPYFWRRITQSGQCCGMEFARYLNAAVAVSLDAST